MNKTVAELGGKYIQKRAARADLFVVDQHHRGVIIDALWK